MDEKRQADKLCPTCKEEMVLEIASYPMGSAFRKERFFVDIYRCAKCDRVKLFAAKGKNDMVTCPVCGAAHHANESCVRCAIRTALDEESGK